MPGIFPDTASGGLVVRTAAGVCQAPANVGGFTCPAAPFESTCDLTALPSDCTARITAVQINSITSELVNFAACLNPDGLWNCGSTTNLCTMFQAWQDDNLNFDGVTIIGVGSAADPYRVSADGLATAICADDSAADALAGCLIDPTVGNSLIVGGTGRLFVPGAGTPLAQVTAICADDAAADALASCLLSADAGNGLNVGTDGRLFSDGCFCPPTRVAGVPVVPPAPGEPTLAQDTTSPGSLYFWDPVLATWVPVQSVAAVHELDGSEFVQVAAPVVAPGANTVSGNNSFVIPNSSLSTINVVVDVAVAGELSYDNGEGGSIFAFLRDGGVAGPIICASGNTGGANLSSGGNIAMNGGTTRNCVIAIPPGGRAVTLQLGRGPDTGGAGGGALITNHTAVVTWHGTSAATFN